MLRRASDLSSARREKMFSCTSPRSRWKDTSLSCQRLEAGNVLSLKTLRAFLHFKLHCLTFVERLVSFHRDRGEVHENIFSRLALDESEALRSIKPLHCSLFLHWPASHAQLRPGRSQRYWNCVASLGPFPGGAKRVLTGPERVKR